MSFSATHRAAKLLIAATFGHIDALLRSSVLLNVLTFVG